VFHPLSLWPPDQPGKRGKSLFHAKGPPSLLHLQHARKNTAVPSYSPPGISFPFILLENQWWKKEKKKKRGGIGPLSHLHMKISLFFTEQRGDERSLSPQTSEMKRRKERVHPPSAVICGLLGQEKGEKKKPRAAPVSGALTSVFLTEGGGGGKENSSFLLHR